METSEYKHALGLVLPYQESPPVDVVALAKRFGLAVWESPALPSGIAGKLFMDKDHGGRSGFSVVVHKSDGASRKRFTIAHEIAHFLLHRNRIGQGIEDNEWYRGGLTTSEESEANRFAADVLMPRHLLRHLTTKGITDLGVLATTFEVSKAAMRIRLSTTG